MNATPQPAARMLQNHEILGELLHSVSQPLTSLCCSLELSVEKAAGQQQEAVAAALEQAERVIGQVRLLREYLDAEMATPTATPTAFAPVVRGVVEQMSTIAAVDNIELGLAGSSRVTIAISEPRLRLALQYLLAGLIERRGAKRRITLSLQDKPHESVLYARSGGSSPAADRPAAHEHEDPAILISRKVRLAIAARVLESAGATLTTVDGTPADFVIHIPRLSSRPV